MISKAVNLALWRHNKVFLIHVVGNAGELPCVYTDKFEWTINLNPSLFKVEMVTKTKFIEEFIPRLEFDLSLLF
jgi:hypothetical protein